MMKSRQWRVGSWSMGIAMVIMGVLLIVSQVTGVMWLDRILFWWPMLFILIGAEVLVYLWRSPVDSPKIRYDMLSMIFVALFGAGCLLFSVGHATGAVEEIREAITSQRMNVEVQPSELELASSVRRIVVQAERNLGDTLRIDAGPERQASVFGSCRVSMSSDAAAEQTGELKLVSSKQVGNTVYLMLQIPAEKHGFNHYSPSCRMTVVLPQELEVELSTGSNMLELPSGELPEGWSMASVVR